MKKLIYLLITLVLSISCDNDNDSGNLSSSEGSGKGGSLARFVIVDNYMYAVDYNNLNVYSLINDEDPVLVNTSNVGFSIETIFNYDNSLFIGSENGMYIYNITDREHPQFLSDAQHFTACDPVVANNTHAFVTLHSNTWCGNNINQLEIYNITDITAPQLLLTRSLTYPKGLALYNNYLFVCDDSVKIFEVSYDSPENVATTLVGNINKEAFDVIINNDILILIGANGLYQYQLNSENINEITELSTISI